MRGRSWNTSVSAAIAPGPIRMAVVRDDQPSAIPAAFQ
jgi:hypothetical protein